MNELFTLVGLLVGAYLVGRRGASRQVGLPSGGEWIFVGIVIGPALELVERDVWLSMGPVLDFGVGWVGLLLGVYFGAPDEGSETRSWPSLFASLAALLTFAVLAALLGGAAYLINPRWEQWWPLWAAVVACGVPGSRQALRWIRRWQKADILHPVWVALSNWGRVSGMLAAFAAVVAVAAQSPDGTDWAVLAASDIGVGAALGLLGAVILGRAFDRDAMWGTVLGLALLGTGLSLRLDQPPVAMLFMLGLTLARFTPQVSELRNLLQVTRGPTSIVVLVAAGGLMQPELLVDVWWWIPLFLAARALARLGGGALLSLSDRALRPSMGLADFSVGPMSAVLAVSIALNDGAGSWSGHVLAVMCVVALISESFAPRLLQRHLEQSGELVPLDQLDQLEVQGQAEAAEAEAETKDAGASVEAAASEGEEDSEGEGEDEHAEEEEAVAAASWGTTAMRAGVLVSLFWLQWIAVQAAPEVSGWGPAMGGLGFLILTGTLSGQVVERFAMPRVTGYLIAGLAAGPYVVGLFSASTVAQLSVVNGLALALLALEAGAELTTSMLRENFKALSYGAIALVLVVTAVLAGAWVAVSPWLDMMQGISLGGRIGVGVLWGLVAVSMSPAAVLAVLAETRAGGPVTRHALGTVVVLEVMVLLLVAIAMPLVQPLIDPTAAGSLMEEIAHAGHEIVGSIAVGTTLGLLLALYILVFGERQLLLTLVVVGFFVNEFTTYLGFDVLLEFIAAGFVIRNLTSFGGLLLHTLERSAVVMVIFFAASGASLDLASLGTLWPAVLVLGFVRMAGLFGASVGSAKLAKQDPVVGRWAWTAYVAQGALALALAALVEAKFGVLKPGFSGLVLAVLGLNLLLGPVLLKVGLGRADEVGKGGSEPH